MIMSRNPLAVALAALAVAPAVHAMTDAEIEARFRKYEERIEALQTEVKELKANGGVVYVEDMEKQTQRNTKQIDDIKSRMDAEAEKLKVNGFMTAAVSHGDDPVDAGYDVDSNPNFRGDARAGLQFNYQLGENASAVLQVVAHSRTNEPWETNAEWAYIDYGVSRDLDVRMGRLRIPMYMFSETLDVGYSYPWVRPPIELYQTTLTSYEGADAMYRFATGDINHTLQPFLGSSLNHDDVDQPYGTFPVFGGIPGAYPPVSGVLDLDFKDLYGVTLNSTLGNWTTKATAMHLGLDGEIRLLDGLPIPGTPGLAAGDVVAEISDNLQYYALGGMYDNGSLLGMVEVAHIRADRESLLGDSVSGQGTLAYRINRWTPYITYAWAQSVNDADVYLQSLGALPNRNMKSASLGVRRELTNQLSAKLEWNNYFDMENNGSYGSGSSSLGGSLGDDANVYTFALDAVF